MGSKTGDAAMKFILSLVASKDGSLSLTKLEGKR